MISKVALSVCSALTLVALVSGHGYLADPPNRGSLWRYPQFQTHRPPINYDDNQMFCGGFKVQWEMNNGRCGLCGDNYADPQPRDNEIGGKYYRDIVARRYHEGSNIQVIVNLTAAHSGHYIFSLCNLDEFGQESEQCFQRHQLPLVTGEPVFQVTDDINRAMEHKAYLKLPEGLVCKHCVLNWHYIAGNNWGTCEDGTQALSCGAQENFRTCSDIAIDPRI